MRYSQYFLPTLKEVPSEAEVPSHQLMLRAGMIRKLTSGIYSYLPLGLQSIQKVEAIIREEMNCAGAIEVLLPCVQPAELWEESHRWDRPSRGFYPISQQSPGEHIQTKSIPGDRESDLLYRDEVLRDRDDGWPLHRYGLGSSDVLCPGQVWLGICPWVGCSPLPG